MCAKVVIFAQNIQCVSDRQAFCCGNGLFAVKTENGNDDA